MKTHELVESIKSLYGGFEPMDLIAAVEDGVINTEEQSALGAVMRVINYEKMAKARADSAPRAILAEKSVRTTKRRAALAMDVAPGMVLRGSTWVSI